jgi:anti-anti-sigma regulatory factor
MSVASCSIDIYEQSPQTLVLQLDGEFDLVCEPALQRALDGLSDHSAQSLAVELSGTQFIGVGCLRRIVFTGKSFSSTEFRSPMPIVEKMLHLLGFVDGTVRIECASRRDAPHPRNEDSSRDGRNDSLRNAPEVALAAQRASRRCSDQRGAPYAQIAALAVLA